LIKYIGEKMIKNKKAVVLVMGKEPTIQGGLDIMSRGLKVWHLKLMGPANHRVKITPPLSKREKGKFPFAY
jgi:hypothetical protein